MDTLTNRRSFLGRTSLGLGATALAPFGPKPRGFFSAKMTPRFGPGAPHHAPKAKRVIFLCMAGGPSHLETFDHKPELAKLNGQPMPESFTKGQPIAHSKPEAQCLGPLFPFRGTASLASRSLASFPASLASPMTSRSCARCTPTRSTTTRRTRG
ncbi:MAG: hypothetical protein CM1200mP34_0040 [Verrucomicrobiales bacterium]|nr:MAG: hypothetical protein CM1200mP34_0040 [Verrucomicrobiales bacterium]